jgi:hypothetical protein
VSKDIIYTIIGTIRNLIVAGQRGSSAYDRNLKSRSKIAAGISPVEIKENDVSTAIGNLQITF